MTRVFFMIGLLLFGVLAESCNEISSARGVEANDQRLIVLSKSESPRVGFRAPTFSLPDIQGNDRHLSEFRGKVILLNFWATWCGPCALEMPSMERLYQEFRDKGFEILAVSSDMQGQRITKPFREQFGLTFPILHDLRHEVGSSYHIRSIPASVLVDKGGVIVYRVPGARDWYSDKARRMIRQLLDTP